MSQPASAQIDPRGPRFTAAVTLVILAAALITPRPLTLVLVGIQAAFFVIGAGRGVQYTPTAWVFRTFIRPRLAAPAHLEDARAPRFAQTVGLVFAVVALIGYGADVTLLGAIALGFAVAAAFLNAVFGFCLGCEMYLLIQRMKPSRSNPTTVQAPQKKEAIA